MMRSYAICILLFVTIKVSAQLPAAVTDSLVAYEKLIYHARDEQEANRLILAKAVYLKTNGNIPAAYATYTRVNESVFPDSTKAHIYFDRALCAYLTSAYSECDFHLSKIRYFIEDQSYYHKRMWLQVLSLNEQYRWTEAKEIFREYVSAAGIHINVDSAYAFIPRVKLKKEQVAEGLSTFLPGAGQLYIGEYGHGMINGTLLLACLGWGTYNVLNGYYITGVFTGYFAGYSFYTGGMRYASEGVKRANARIADRYNIPLRELILGIQPAL
jgi:TM2 domain-containing membrane protein YozV